MPSLMGWCTECKQWCSREGSHWVSGSRTGNERRVCGRCYKVMTTDGGGGTWNHDSPNAVHWVHIYTDDEIFGPTPTAEEDRLNAEYVKAMGPDTFDPDTERTG